MSVPSTIHCENAEEYFGNTDESKSYLGEVSVKWLVNKAGNKSLETGAREYQREKVASIEWKQALMHTILCNPYARIPQIHVRVKSTPIGLKYEIMDGQQRVTSIIDFLNGQFVLEDKLTTHDRIDISKKSAKELELSAPQVYNRIMDYRITVIWYENLSDDEVSELFVDVLNNQNNLNAQEKRNAYRGQASEWIRNTARYEPHELFSRTTKTSGKKSDTIKLTYIPSLKLKGRMEVDEWLSQLIYMFENGLKEGVTSQNKLSKWFRDIQLPGNWAASDSAKYNKYRKSWDNFLKYSMNIVKAIPKNYTSKITPMNLQLLLLYAWEIEKNRSQRIQDLKKFTSAYYETINKWSDTQKKTYMRHWQILNKRQMPPMKELFGGKNPNAIQTIMWIFDREINSQEPDRFDWGVVKLDHRESFTKEDVIRKWKEQDRKCFYTNRILNEDELVGDHYIPRSWGVDRGGVTEYTNLVVTDSIINNQKLNMHGDDFINKLKGAT